MHILNRLTIQGESLQTEPNLYLLYPYMVSSIIARIISLNMTGIGLRPYIRLLNETTMVSSLDELRTYSPYRDPGI